MSTIKMKDLLLAAGVLGLGLAVGGSVVMLESEDAVAATTTRTFGILLEQGFDVSNCVDHGATDYKHTITTKESSETTYVEFGTCVVDGYETCKNSCDSFSISGLDFSPHDGVEINQGSVLRGVMGWLGTDPGHGERTDGTVTDLADCYVRPEKDAYELTGTGSYTVQKDDTNCPTCRAFCVAYGDFS